jgi:uncharacterized protein
MVTPPATVEAPFDQTQSKDPFWAPASVVGLCGFGTTTMIAGMGIASSGINWGVDNGAVFPMALAFGGSAQFVAGVIMLRRGEIFPGSAFMGYGAFWWAFTLFLSGLTADKALGPTAPYDIAWFMLVWTLFTLTFAINSHYHGPGIAFVFWTLVLAFLLLTIDFAMVGSGHAPSNDLWIATGVDTFICGFAAWYVATGIITAQHHKGKKVLPF